MLVGTRKITHAGRGAHSLALTMLFVHLEKFRGRGIHLVNFLYREISGGDYFLLIVIHSLFICHLYLFRD